MIAASFLDNGCRGSYAYANEHVWVGVKDALLNMKRTVRARNIFDNSKSNNSMYKKNNKNNKNKNVNRKKTIAAAVVAKKVNTSFFISVHTLSETGTARDI